MRRCPESRNRESRRNLISEDIEIALHKAKVILLQGLETKRINQAKNIMKNKGKQKNNQNIKVKDN